jgi:hypothetical protein
MILAGNSIDMYCIPDKTFLDWQRSKSAYGTPKTILNKGLW